MGGTSFPSSAIINVAEQRALARLSSGTGSIEEVTLAALMNAALAALPTTEPVAPNVAWLNAGAVELSAGIPPVITDQPDAATVDEGETATFALVATNATSYQWQKQESGAGAWANIPGATSTSYQTGSLTNAADNGDAYRCVVTGEGGEATSSTAALTVRAPAPLTGITSTVAISPQYLDPDWQAAAYPTVNVEKTFGSGVYQDLYPHTDGQLYTAVDGGGQTATAFAAGEKLLVEIPYNQALASTGAAGHPTAVTDSARRVLLDISVPAAPRFAGIQQGTQDAGQHATERGYDLNLSIVSNAGLTILTLDQLPAAGTTDYLPYQNNGGSTQNILVNPSNSRWYPGASVSVGKINPIRMPSLKAQFADTDGQTSSADAYHSVAGGAFHASTVATAVNATSTPLRWLGPTSPLTGSAYAFVVVSGEYTNVDSVKRSSSLVSRVHKACVSVYGANDITLYSPLQYQFFPINLDTTTGTIRIVCASAASTEIEASYNGSAYQSIGTTDSNGYLEGTLTGASPGDATLNVRVAGQASVAATVANVRVGVMVARAGQSNADGRGDDVTLTATRSIAANTWANSTATQKSWLWALLQSYATELSCPVCMTGWSAGATYLYFNSGGTVDGSHGHWNASNPGTVTVDSFATLVAYSHLAQEEPNYIIWHQGEDDANGGVSTANYQQALIDMWVEFQSRTGWTNKLWVMQIGRDGVVADTQVDAIREAQSGAVTSRPDLFELGGCLAHLPVGDGASDLVHFYTQSQKDSVVAVFRRHAVGAGRGPQFSSMTASGTSIVIATTGGVSPLTIDGAEAASPIGWTVTDAAGSRTVSAVAVSGLEVTLTVDQVLSGTVTVKWLSHYSGIGTTLLDSDGTTPLPPEPFSESVAAS